MAAQHARRAGAPAPALVEPPAPSCAVCGGVLDLYVGSNPHKAGTGYCPACGVRAPVAVEVPAGSNEPAAD